MASEPHCDQCKGWRTHNYYVTRGIDAQKVRDEANLQKAHGFKSRVHYHRVGDFCNERCDSR